MAPTQANRRLQKEYANLAKAPPPYILARPNETNLLETYFILRGPEDSPYAGGEYYGVLLFTAQYPFAPPGIKMLTPSGRFQPDRKICTSMSDFHPGSWNPAWSIETILCGLLSFMLEEEVTTGAIRTSEAEKKRCAKESHAWNIKQAKFKTIFPEYAQPQMIDLPNMGKKERNLPASSSSSTPAPTNEKSVPLHRLETRVEHKVDKGRAGSGKWMYVVGAVLAIALLMRLAG